MNNFFSMPNPKKNMIAACLEDNLYFIGGVGKNNQLRRSVYIYDVHKSELHFITFLSMYRQIGGTC